MRLIIALPWIGCTRSYTVDGDNLAPSADTVLIDNSYLPAAFTTDFGSAPWTLTSPFKETCSVRVGNMSATQFTASGEHRMLTGLFTGRLLGC